MKPVDVLVVGGGLAGLTAALAASERGRSVALLTQGSGALAISGACVDVLGYAGGAPVRGDPLESLSLLPAEHPYRLLGADTVRQSLEFFTRVCRNADLHFPLPGQANIWAPNILGGFKPTSLYFTGMDRETLAAAGRLVLPLMPWLKDCRLELAALELKKQKRLKDKELLTPKLPNPFAGVRRDPTQLDLARYVDSPEGEGRLLEALAAYAGPDALFLLPPVLGVLRHGAIRQRLTEALGCGLAEMLAPPPGVGGLRIRNAFMTALSKAGVLLAENARVSGAVTEGRRCLALSCQGPERDRVWEASAFIIATGGFLGGGFVSGPDFAREAIFGLDIGAAPERARWSAESVFAEQPYSGFGVKVNAGLNALSPGTKGKTALENVFFVGRSLAGYDWAVEKSGNGVALASAFHAARQC